MNIPMTPTVYTESAYRSTEIPAQPPHKWQQDANRASLTRVPLRWGSYANIEPWKDVDAQLLSQAEFLDNQEEGALYINHKRWNRSEERRVGKECSNHCRGGTCNKSEDQNICRGRVSLR